MRRFISTLAPISALALSLVAEAAPHRPIFHPNSLTVFSMAEGPDGLLWLAADDGLYRFDGFHYHKISAYPFASARFVAFTRDGSLWAADFEGMAHVRKNRFEVILNGDISGMAAYPDQVYARLNDGLARIDLDGSVHHLKLSARRDLTIDTEGKMWAVCQLAAGCSFDPAHPEQRQSVDLPPTLLYAQVVRDSLGRIWAADPERAVLVENNRIAQTLERLRSPKSDRPGPLFEGRNGQLWFLGETVRGLIPRVEFRDRADHDRYPPVSGLEDSRGHVWVASLGLGLVEWTPDPQWQRWFQEDFGKELPVQAARGLEGAMMVATQKNVYRLDAQADRWIPITKAPFRFYALFPLENGDFLASIRDFGLARLSAQGVVVEHVPNPVPGIVEEYREILRDRKGQLWVGAKRALFRIEGQPGSLRLREEDLPDVAPREKASPVDLGLDTENRLWVGYVGGLAWLDDQDHWHKIATDQPVTMVRGFALAGDDIWVAYRRNGGFTRLHRAGNEWKITPFSPNNGYPPSGTEFLRRDSRGWIWRGTDQGVFVSDGKHVEPNDWLHINLGNGLAANEAGQYGFLEDSTGAVWITGDEGVTCLRPDTSWFNAPTSAAPSITRIEGDGRVYLYPETLPSQWPVATKVIRIDVGSLNGPSFRINPVRYRLLPGSGTWQLSRDGSLEFRNLREDDYVLQVSFTGNQPAPVAAYPLRIGAGSSWLSRYWWIALMAAFGAIAAVVRYAPGLDRLRFRIEKSMFLLGRRLGRGETPSSGNAPGAALDHSGDTLLGRYLLGSVVSRGGFSVVYEARDLRNGDARLVVKVLNQNPRQEGWVRDRFAHEVAALRSVEHPGVVPILDSWISPAGEPCLAMPFLAGQTLRSALEETPFDSARAARVISQLGSALAEVHSRGVVHRDLKPENLILLGPGTAEEQMVIIDFGTAGLRTAENELAATTLMSGSFHYMAPERLTGRYSPASDVFSLGVIILEILTGKRLANLRSMYSEAAFHDELAATLRARLNPETAERAAELLAPAYDPDPRRRPADVALWTRQIAEVVGMARA